MQSTTSSDSGYSHWEIARRFFSKAPSLRPDEEQAEYSQTVVRIAILIFMTAYVFVTNYFVSADGRLEPWARNVLIYLACYAPSTFLLLYWAKRYPGHYPARRMFAMVNDYAAISFVIIAGCKVMLPGYAIIVWMAVGHGIRYGLFYLVAAAIVSQLSLAAIFLLTPYWQEDLSLVATLSLTALAVPFYATIMLRNLDKARQLAEESSLAKSRFLAQASHDLRQPVHAIGLFVLSLRQTSLSEAQRGIVERIDRSLQGVARLFRSLLDVATLDSGKLEPKFEPVRLGPLLKEIAKENMRAAGWPGVDLQVVDTSLAVATDRALLTTMVQNLLSNAIKYSDGQRIVIGCRRRSGQAVIQVSDQGKGVAEEHIPHLFNEFYQVKERGEPDRQGVGLGLSIVSRLATMIGARIEFRSQLGCGTSVSIVDLPIWKGTIADKPIGAATTAEYPLKGMQIVLVEDNIDVLDATKELLASWGCMVSAHPAIPNQLDRCDLLITDFDLGGGTTGADCIAKVRKLIGQDVACIVTTGHDAVPIVEELGDASIPVLKKPLRPSELRSAISAMRLRMRSNASPI